MVNEFNECFREVFSAAGDIIIKSMMGGYLVYHKHNYFASSFVLKKIMSSIACSV